MWSISNIANTLPDETWKTLFSSNELLLNIVIGWLSLPIAYILIHNLFLKFVPSYKELKSHAQTVVIHHATEAILLSLFFIPMTYYLSLLFEEELSYDDLKSKFVQFMTLASTVLFMYIVELASRYQNPNLMLVLHHLMTYLNTVFLLAFPSNANVKASFLLIYFVEYESITFMGLVMYRLFPHNKFTPKVIFAGIIFMALSRPFQLILIFGFLVSAWKDLVAWHAIVQMCITLLLTGIQIWSLKIHVGLWKKSLEKQRKNNKHADDGDEGKEITNHSSNLVDLSLEDEEQP